jgi:serine/threonine-protein kinase
VPELFGSSERGATVLLERSGLALGGVTRAPSDEVGEGLVVSTDPPAEAVLPRNARVSLLISTGAGQESFVMPDLVGRDVLIARRELEAMGFRVLSRSPAHGGAIFSQNPAPGTRLERGATILVEAAGPVRR